MSRQVTQFWAWFFIAALGLSGCHPTQPFFLHEDGDLSHYLDQATEISQADLDSASLAETVNTKAPLTVTSPHFDEIWELSLEEAMSISLQNSKVIRTIGQIRQLAQITNSPPDRLTLSPESVSTIYDPAIQ